METLPPPGVYQKPGPPEYPVGALLTRHFGQLLREQQVADPLFGGTDETQT
jgi:hypothetical protein